MSNNKTTYILLGIILLIFLIPLLIVLVINLTQRDAKEDLLGINYDIKENTATLNYDTANPVVAMYVRKYGSIVIELYPDIAPNTVNNFISLVKKGFYDDNSFHRLVPDFVLQGGDPEGTGKGGPGYSIKGEFSNNGFKNKLSHKKKIVSMARSQEKDSAGSQFFIMLADNKSLDGDYAAFGKVIDGWKNVEQISKNEPILDESTGKLKSNLTIVKALVDTKKKDYDEPKKITS